MSARPSTAGATPRHSANGVALRTAFEAHADPATGRVPAAKLAAVLTAAGWDLSSFATGQGQILVQGALANDVNMCLRAIGYSDRTIADGRVAVTLAQIMPWFQNRMSGVIGIKNAMLRRAKVLGGECWECEQAKCERAKRERAKCEESKRERAKCE